MLIENGLFQWRRRSEQNPFDSSIKLNRTSVRRQQNEKASNDLLVKAVDLRLRQSSISLAVVEVRSVPSMHEMWITS